MILARRSLNFLVYVFSDSSLDAFYFLLFNYNLVSYRDYEHNYKKYQELTNHGSTFAHTLILLTLRERLIGTLYTI
jgi:hypothetical protein